MFFETLPSYQKLLDSVSGDTAITTLLPIYDKVLLEYSWFNKWLSQFEYTYAVDAGEELKELRSFPLHMENLLNIVGHKSARNLGFVSIGGGSVGDFVGFVASTYKRGAGLIHIPTTWLAALDSSHGGKTALNVGGVKNQIGTFYSADAHIICGEFLKKLPQEELKSAYGELVKMAIIKGGVFSENLNGYSGSLSDSLWHFLSYAVESKLEVVSQDPYETTGERQVLNLGHTLGHIFEAQCGLAHGLSVLLGLHFSLNWSKGLGYIEESSFQFCKGLLDKYFSAELPPALQEKDILDGLLRDKKCDESGIQFIFVRGEGSVFRKAVTPVEFLNECKRQGVCR